MTSTSSPNSIRIPSDWFQRHPYYVAYDLIGKIIVRKFPSGHIIRAKITEAEAYCHGDPAAHCCDKVTSRNKVMFGSVNCVYTYTSYGIHTCFNIIARDIPNGQLAGGVLIRGAVIIDGKEFAGRQDLNGPGKLCQGLYISMNDNGKDLSTSSDLYLEYDPIISSTIDSSKIQQTTRIGIKKAIELPWRFVLIK